MAAEALVQTEAEAAAREVRAHGCCCQGCKLIWELYFAIGLDILILVLGSPPLADRNAPMSYRVWLATYLLAVVLPSICFFGRALVAKAGRPRLLLTRFLVFWKVPVYFLLYSLFFTVSPWAAEVAEFMCNPKNNFEHGKISKHFVHDGVVDIPECVAALPKLMLPGMIPRCLIYLYSVKGAWEYMRCHPDNDGVGLCSSRERPAEDYDALLQLA